MIFPFFSLLRRNEVLLAGICVAALSGCADKSHLKTTPTAPIQFVSNAQQTAEVVAALEIGDTKRALKLLKPMIKRDPANAQFRTLETSIKGNPETILGSQSFEYAVKPGDRMQALSQRFMGDPLKFFLLARYNGLKNGQLISGQKIRIPGKAPVAEPGPVARAKPKPVPATAKPSRPDIVVVKPKANPVHAATLRGRGLAALNRGKVADAVIMLRKAQAVDPANSAIRRDLERAERLLASVKARK